MSEPGIDELLAQQDSKYRLTVSVAKRAQQLLRYRFKNTVLTADEIPRMHTIEGDRPDPNAVTWAIREMRTGRLVVGEDLVPDDKLARLLDQQYPSDFLGE